MVDFDHAARVILAVLVAVAVLQYAALFGAAAMSGHWPHRITIIGGLIVLLYVFLGQFKAMLYTIPFDLLSALGVVGFLIFDLGSARVLKERQRCGRS